MIYNFDLKKPTPVAPTVDRGYISFQATSEFSVEATPAWNGVVEYSTDATTWTVWDGGSVAAATDDSSSSKFKVYYLHFRGTGNTHMSTSSKYGWSIDGGLSMSVSGDMDALLDYSNGSEIVMDDYCFYHMFDGCSSLTGASGLTLGSLTLSTRCYAYMFANCTGLQTTGLPELPALTLATGCYMGMFMNCSNFGVYTSIATGRPAYRIPTIGTGTTASGALTSMFSGTGGDVSTPSINTTYYIGLASASSGGDLTA